MNVILLSFVLCGQNLYRVENYTVHDADTLTNCTIHLGFGVALTGKGIRAFGYDAWEVSYARQTVVITPEEIIKGKKARDAFKDLLSRSKALYIGEGKTDPYGRISGIFWLDIGQPRLLDVSEWMRSNNHLRSQ